VNSGGPDLKVANEGGETNYGGILLEGKVWQVIKGEGDKNISKFGESCEQKS
jgi:hypothetical protein